eukprot:CFRG6911T1
MHSQIMRVILVVVAIAAQAYATKVHLFAGLECTNLISLSSSVLNDQETCSKINMPMITVSEWANTQYQYIKLSDRPDEITLFGGEQECTKYTSSSTDPVPFIRAMVMNECVPCYKCGNIKSVRFDTTQIYSKSEDDNAAGTASPSIFVAVAAAAITALFA